MNFYLLKSTFQRRYVGDVIFDINQIEGFIMFEERLKDRENPVIRLSIKLKSSQSVHAKYQNIEEAKQVIKEIIGDKVSDEDLNDFLPVVE